jgi:hypothetical protein
MRAPVAHRREPLSDGRPAPDDNNAANGYDAARALRHVLTRLALGEQCRENLPHRGPNVNDIRKNSLMLLLLAAGANVNAAIEIIEIAATLPRMKKSGWQF